MNRRSILSLCAAIAAMTVAANSYAVTVSASGTTADGDADPVSASLNFTTAGNVGTIVLTNTTPTTRTAGQLLTGVDLTFTGVGPVTLTAGSGISRTVDNDGNFTDSGAVDLMTAGNNGATWSLVENGGALRLNFNPDAQYGIIGPATNGAYAGANGSINGNPGHNPYLAETGTFTITGEGLTEGSLTGVTFLFGTDFQNPVAGEVPPTGGEEPGGEEPGGENPPGGAIPEPASMGLLGLGIAALGLRFRRRA